MVEADGIASTCDTASNHLRKRARSEVPEQCSSFFIEGEPVREIPFPIAANKNMVEADGIEPPTLCL